MSEPTLFVPYTGKHGAAPVIRESRLIRDLSMPERDWSKFYEPTFQRERWWKPQTEQAA